MIPHPPIDVCWYIWTICSYLSLTITSLSLLSLNSFSPPLVNLSFSTMDKTAADEVLSSFCLFVQLEAWSIYFSKDFHKFISLFLITNVHLKICLEALFFQNIGLTPLTTCGAGLWKCTSSPGKDVIYLNTTEHFTQNVWVNLEINRINPHILYPSEVESWVQACAVQRPCNTK